MRSRAYRRHKRAVKLARRYRILLGYSSYAQADMTPKVMHWHLRCNCFDDPRERALRRRSEARAWRREWDA